MAVGLEATDDTIIDPDTPGCKEILLVSERDETQERHRSTHRD